ncbi:MAG: phosphotransferase [Desulfovibrio sp.]
MLDPLEPFGLRTARRRPDLRIPGSPERCVARSVLEDTSGRVWLLEQLAARQVPRREAIAATLGALQTDFPDACKAVLPVFRKSCEKGFCATLAGLRWQVSPFVFSDELPRPGYLNQEERGASLAMFMSALQGAARGLPEALVAALGPRLDLSGYARELLDTLEQREPGVHAILARLWPRLDTDLQAGADLPLALQHGDLHPLNVLWRGQAAVAIIDWEFLGVKPEWYDLANLLGCLGFEHPDGLTGALALRLTRALARGGYLCPESWALLPRCTALLRLAWLSEWLRKGERDLVDMELEYMGLLLRREEELRRVWHMA